MFQKIKVSPEISSFKILHTIKKLPTCKKLYTGKKIGQLRAKVKAFLNQGLQKAESTSVMRVNLNRMAVSVRHFWHVAAWMVFCFQSGLDAHQIESSSQSLRWLGTPQTFYRSPFQTSALSHGSGNNLKEGELRLDIWLPLGHEDPSEQMRSNHTSPYLNPGQAPKGRQAFETGFSLRFPAIQGTAIFRWNPGVLWEWDSQIQRAVHSVDTSFGSGSLFFLSEYSSGMEFRQSWRNATLGYLFDLRPGSQLYLGVQKHYFKLRTGGSFFGNLKLESRVEYANREYHSEDHYGQEEFSGEFSGDWEGTSWVPTLGFSAGMFSLLSQMSSEITLEGSFEIWHRVPDLLDPLTLSPPATSELLDDLRDDVLLHRTRTLDYRSAEPLLFAMPLLTTFSLKPLSFLEISYTKVSGDWELKTAPEDSSSLTGTLNPLEYGSWKVKADHFFMTSLDFDWLSTSLGAFQWKAAGGKGWPSGLRDAGGTFSLSDENHIVPVWNWELRSQGTLRFHLGMQVFPWTHLKTGASYAF